MLLFFSRGESTKFEKCCKKRTDEQSIRSLIHVWLNDFYDFIFYISDFNGGSYSVKLRELRVSERAKCSAVVARINLLLVDPYKSFCDRVGIYQTDGKCRNCKDPAATGPFCEYTNSNTCSNKGTVDDQGRCECNPGIQGEFCDSESAADAEAADFIPFYAAAGITSAFTLFGSGSYAYYYLDGSKDSKLNILWFALFVTLRIFDTMSDWSMFGIVLQSERFTLKSTYGSEEGGNNNASILQKASLAFSIIGTLLLVLDLITFRKRAAAWFSKSVALEEDEAQAVALGMGTILLFEDIPQLAIASVYLKSVAFGVGGINEDDAVVIASLILSILSLLGNGVMAVQSCSKSASTGSSKSVTVPPENMW